MECEQKLTASYDWNDSPLNTGDIEGLDEAIEQVDENHDERVLVRCEDRVADYDVYWNSKTDTVRIAALVTGATYEAPDEPKPSLETFGGNNA